ncbi:MAG: hypothetical protein R2710_17720 [Acidimicrobiales bacterium]
MAGSFDSHLATAGEDVGRLVVGVDAEPKRCRRGGGGSVPLSTRSCRLDATDDRRWRRAAHRLLAASVNFSFWLTLGELALGVEQPLFQRSTRFGAPWRRRRVDLFLHCR